LLFLLVFGHLLINTTEKQKSHILDGMQLLLFVGF